MRCLYIIETLGKMEQDTLMIQLYMGTKRYHRGIMKSKKLLLRESSQNEGEVF